MGVKVKVDAADVRRAAARTGVAGRQIKHPVARVLNRAGDKALTQTRRAIAKQMGLRYGRVAQSTVKRYAHAADLSYEMIGKGRFLPLKEFGAKQVKEGVTATAWGRTILYRGAFIPGGRVWRATKSGKRRRIFQSSGKGGGNVFRRVGKSRLPIKPLWGPAVPVEMMRDEPPKVFERTSAVVIQSELFREVAGVLARNMR